MEEVVAKKANMLPGYIVVLLTAISLIALGIVMGTAIEETGVLVIGIAVGALLAVFAVVQIVKYVKTPVNLITYADGKFTFVGGVTCEPYEITHVLLKLTRNRYGVVARTGGLVITVRGAKIKINYIAHVKEAEERLSRICNAAAQAAVQAAMSTAPSVVPQTIADDQPSVAPQTPEAEDDPFNS